jgi:hypothetical protein
MMEADPQDLTDYSKDGVDLTLIRWMLSLTPAERLQFLQRQVNAMGENQRTQCRPVTSSRLCAPCMNAACGL